MEYTLNYLRLRQLVNLLEYTLLLYIYGSNKNLGRIYKSENY